MTSASAAHWVAIATLIRPQGRRGELLAEPLSDLPEIFAAGREVLLAKSGATAPAADAAPIYARRTLVPNRQECQAAWS